MADFVPEAVNLISDPDALLLSDLDLEVQSDARHEGSL
jgi:hypothetical protein